MAAAPVVLAISHFSYDNNLFTSVIYHRKSFIKLATDVLQRAQILKKNNSKKNHLIGFLSTIFALPGLGPSS